MFTRIKKSGKYEYLQICESKREGKKVKQRVITTLGRLDILCAKGEVENLVRSLAKYSERALMILSGKSDPKAITTNIGPALIFERLWQATGIKEVIERLLLNRNYSFKVERAVFLTVLHRLFVSGSDRLADRWKRDYRLEGAGDIKLHHLYRSMAWLGEELADQEGAVPFSPRCMKDNIEEGLFFARRDLFSSLDLVFFDTTSIYFEGSGGESLGERGNSKDNRPDLKQMVMGIVLDDSGKPICCEMWPGNTADVKTLIPVMDRIRRRFSVRNFCVVADRGMISRETISQLENDERKLPYILGARMRKVNEIKTAIAEHQDLSAYREVYPEKAGSESPAPLKVKDVYIDSRRYILCYNGKQARKDAEDRRAIVESLMDRLKSNPKSLVGNKGYRKYMKITGSAVELNEDKIDSEAVFDGKWVLQSNLDWPAEKIALKYKELLQIERVFRDVKSILITRPVFHQRDEAIRGHIFCSFLALILRKELERRLEKHGYNFEWAAIKQDLSSLQETIIEENNRTFAIRSMCQGVCGKVFKAVGVSLPPTIKEA